MNLSKFLSVSCLLIFVSHSASNSAVAATPPQFISCITPSGTVKVSYDNGIHGIVGNTQTFTGKDTVYALSQNSLTQCFCATDGAGIQTNWWKIGNLIDAETKVLESQGWIYVPTGSVWGLEDTPYLAKNENYSCKTESRVGGASSINNSSNSSGSVLGLPSTGSIFVAIFTLLATFSILLGIKLRRKQLTKKSMVNC